MVCFGLSAVNAKMQANAEEKLSRKISTNSRCAFNPFYPVERLGWKPEEHDPEQGGGLYIDVNKLHVSAFGGE